MLVAACGDGSQGPGLVGDLAIDGGQQADSVPAGGDPQDAGPGADTQPYAVGLTHHRPDGNRWAHGRGAMPRVRSIDVPLRAIPLWLVAAETPEGRSAWLAAFDDGSFDGFIATDAGLQPAAVAGHLAPRAPPVLTVAKGGELALVSAAGASQTTHPTLTPGGDWVFVRDDLALIVGGTPVPAIEALPDARILVDERGRLALLSDPTERYAHGVLGDALEAGSVTLFANGEALRITLDAPEVIEAITPLWADLDDDGARELIVTVSDASVGARMRVYAEDGALRAEAPPVGTGNRWRHAIAVAPFGDTDRLQLAVVRTPHIGGIVELYELSGSSLAITATAAPYTSHRYGSRNLDLALAVDADGDGRVELLVPTQDRRSLCALRFDAPGLVQRWCVALAAKAEANLAAARHGVSGGVAIGVVDGATLRVWLPTR